jgi:hypothetical protein
MNWQEKRVSLYRTHSDNIGRPATLRDIIMSAGLQDISTLIELRKLDPEQRGYKKLTYPFKGSLQAFTPAALLATKEKENVKVIEMSGMLQLDFDYEKIKKYDIEELKQAVFALPFIGFCGLSCSGTGFYALAAIGDTRKLTQYAEHCFEIFQEYSIPLDTSKGRNAQDLRYVSYDKNMLIRGNPEVLHVTNFRTKAIPKEKPKHMTYSFTGCSGLVAAQLNKIRTATIGNRWLSVQQVAFTLGGKGDRSALDNIKQEIISNPEFEGEHEKYFKCAETCFEDGSLKPL